MSRRAAAQKAAAPKKKRSFLWRLFLWCFWMGFIGFVLVGIAIGVAAYIYYPHVQELMKKADAYDLSKLDALNATSHFVDVNGEEIGRMTGDQDRILLTKEQMGDTLRKAVISAEDKRFYDHGALDYYGLARATVLYVRVKYLHQHYRTEGGSSIEQQLSKNLIGDFSKTFDRKLLESFLAERVEKKYTKDQILTYYMNWIYFGDNYYGVGAAAKGYFGKDAKDLTVPECALLAGIIRAPVSSCPRHDLQSARRRRDITLGQMLEEHFISQEDYAKYVGTPITLVPPEPPGLQNYVMNIAVKETRQILNLTEDEQLPPGLTVQTNINMKLQHTLEDQLNEKLEEISSQGGEDMSLASNVTKKPPLQGCIMLAETDTGRIRAYVGGRDYSHNQFDHISQARRETGALLQPVVYALAFDRMKLHPASMVNASFIDPAVQSTDADMEMGDPAKDVTKFFLTVQDAMSLENKAAFARVGLHLGAENVTSWFRKVGLTLAAVPSDKPNTFLPDPMTLNDVMLMYRTLARDGSAQKFHVVHSIKTLSNETVFLDSISGDNGQNGVIDRLSAEQMTLTMQAALRASPGPAHSLEKDYNLNCGIAGMAGNSEGYRDSWFVGYTPKLMAGVWVGYDDSRPIGGKEKALNAAAPLWGEAMQQADQLGLLTHRPFMIPDQLTKVEIDRSTGALRGLAGLAPEPGCIFTYVRKDQVQNAGDDLPPQQKLGRPRDWTYWLSSFYNQSDETQAVDDPLIYDDKRSNIIPSLAEFSMPGLRGNIVSSDDKVYATMTAEKDLMLAWPAADEVSDSADVVHWMRGKLTQISLLLQVNPAISDEELLKCYKYERFQPLFVWENLTQDQVQKIQDAGWLTKGFGIQTVPRRTYPQGQEICHLIGYLAPDQRHSRSGKFLSGDVLYNRFKGASGLEKVYDKDLTGTDGQFDVSTTPEGYIRSAGVKTPAGQGANVRLAIDGEIQADVEQALNLKKLDAAVLIDVNTGDIVAMGAHPGYDPNLFVPSISAEDWKALNDDPTVPLISRAFGAQFPPGSSFKTITSLAAMKAGVFDPNWVVHCYGGFDIGNVHMDFHVEHGDVTYLEALKHSYNTYFVTLGLKVGRDILIDTARSMGLGSTTNFGLPEVTGRIPDSEFVKRVHGRDFGDGDVANTAIGQGDVLVTPLQMANAMAAIANGGTVYRPRLVKDVEDSQGNVLRAVPIAALRNNALDYPGMANLKEAMIGVIDDGTATNVHRDDMKIAAKTGTAQLPVHGQKRQIAWLCGYLPADNPKYAFAVMVEGTPQEDLHGGRDAGMVAKAIFDAMFNKKPTTPAAGTKPADHPATQYTTIPANITAPSNPTPSPQPATH